MKLSGSQRQALNAGARRPYINRLMQDLRSKYPRAVRDLSDDLLRRRVEHAIERAESHDMTRQSSIAAYVFAMFSVSPDFDKDPRIQTLLTESAVPANLRMKKILRLTKNAQWDEAQQRCGRNWPADLQESRP